VCFIFSVYGTGSLGARYLILEVIAVYEEPSQISVVRYPGSGIFISKNNNQLLALRSAK
jgi:adenine-specific DNA methylase